MHSIKHNVSCITSACITMCIKIADFSISQAECSIYTPRIKATLMIPKGKLNLAYMLN